MTKKDVHVILLAHDLDFGRRPVASKIPPAMWPVVGRLGIERVLDNLARDGVTNVSVCSNYDRERLLSGMALPSGLEARFLWDEMPLGDGGWIKRACYCTEFEVAVVLPAHGFLLSSIEEILTAHRSGSAPLTVFTCPNVSGSQEIPDVYAMDQSVLAYIHDEGYFDIKENVLPNLIRGGASAHAASLSGAIGAFQDWGEYLCVVLANLGTICDSDPDVSIIDRTASRCVWAAGGTEIHPNAKLYGDVVIQAGSQLADGAVVIGPAVIGRHCAIETNAMVKHSVLWDDIHIGRDAYVSHSVMGYEIWIDAGAQIEARPLVPGPQSKSTLMSRPGASRNLDDSEAVKGTAAEPRQWQPSWPLIGGLVAVCLSFCWSYWGSLRDLWSIWKRSDEYSSGMLVPLLAAYILWSKRESLRSVRIDVFWAGPLVVIGAQVLRLLGLYYSYISAIRFSVVVAIAGLVLWLGGKAIFRRTCTVLLFLCLMLPWPHRVQSAVTLPLQEWATSSAVFSLETLGYDILREGNILTIGETKVAVAEACNGLRMITAFFVIAGMVAILSHKAWWEKLLIFASSLPIALVCNTIRLTVTSIAFTMIEGDHWEQLFHDFGGYAMMPLALLLIVLELWLIKLLTVPPSVENKIVIARTAK